MRLFIVTILLCSNQFCSAQIFTTISGGVEFISQAPLEIIEASSNQLQGVLDKENKTFAFKLFIKSFEGFNSSLQQVHFYENYMEVSEFPIATFKGKILEEFEKGLKIYRAKGMLNIHGVEAERILNVHINLDTNSIEFKSDFLVPLAEHNIDLPRIVYQKIAEVIKVKIEGVLMIKE